MCLITLVPKGKDKYADIVRKSIENGLVTNTDGMGYSFKRASTKKVYISKGYRTLKSIWKALKEHNLREEDELMIHLRNGNKGDINTDMCHPFVVSDKADEILANDCYVNKPTFCQNGTFYQFCLPNSIYSDTFWFSRYFMSNKYALDALKYDKEFFDKYLRSVLTTNRVAFLFPNEDIDMIKYGEFIEDDGYFFSNLGYKDKSVYNRGGSRHYSEADFDNEYAVEYYNGRYGRKLAESINKSNEPVKPFSSLKKSGIDSDDIIVASGNETNTFIASNGITYRLYMGIWVPDEYSSVSQFTSCKFDIDEFTYTDFRFISLYDIPSQEIKRGESLEVVDFDETPLKLHSLRKLYQNKLETVYLEQKELAKDFRHEVRDRVREKYKDYYRLVKQLNPSKSTINRIEKLLSHSTAKYNENVIYRGITVRKDALQLYLYMSIKHQNPNDYNTKINKLELV